MEGLGISSEGASCLHLCGLISEWEKKKNAINKRHGSETYVSSSFSSYSSLPLGFLSRPCGSLGFLSSSSISFRRRGRKEDQMHIALLRLASPAL